MAVCRRLGVVLLLGHGGYTYGPEEDWASIEQILRLGDSVEAVAVVRHQVHRPPTGVNTFPNEGIPKVLEQRARFW